MAVNYTRQEVYTQSNYNHFSCNKIFLLCLGTFYNYIKIQLKSLILFSYLVIKVFTVITGFIFFSVAN